MKCDTCKNFFNVNQSKIIAVNTNISKCLISNNSIATLMEQNIRECSHYKATSLELAVKENQMTIIEDAYIDDTFTEDGKSVDGRFKFVMVRTEELNELLKQ